MAWTHKTYGPPGTGKTRYLIELFEQELKTTPPDRIAFLTFTRSARLEALERTKMTEAELPFVRTIHAICYRQLGMSQAQLIKRPDLKEFAKLIGVRLSAGDDPWENMGINTMASLTRDDYLLQLNHLGRHRLVNLNYSLKEAALDIDLKYAKWFTGAYKTWKYQEALLDYTDLLTDYLRYGKPLPIDVIFVDEAQDLSKLQWQAIHKLSANAQKLYIAGDDDQAIFSWAGASSDAFNSEHADDVKYLEQSYRVPNSVLTLAKKVISRVKNRVEKPWLPRNDEGIVKTISYFQDEHLKNPSTLILFRNHHRGQAIKEQLEEMGWPFTGERSTLSSDKVQRALTGWEALFMGSGCTSAQARSMLDYSRPETINKDNVSVLRHDTTRIWKVGDLFIPGTEFKHLFNIMQKMPNKSYLVKTAQNHGFKALLRPTTQLMSIHQSKGRQADTVIIDTEIARKTYDSWWQNPEDEHRVWFVGVTRAQRRLLILTAEGTMTYPL